MGAIRRTEAPSFSLGGRAPKRQAAELVGDLNGCRPVNVELLPERSGNPEAHWRIGQMTFLKLLFIAACIDCFISLAAYVPWPG